MTIRTFEQADRFIIEISNPTNEIKRAINSGFNVETIKFLSAQQNIENQVVQEIAATIDNQIPVANNELQKIVSDNTAITMNTNADNQTFISPVGDATIPASEGMEITDLVNQEPGIEESITNISELEQSVAQETDNTVIDENSEETIIRKIFASDKVQAFNILANCLQKINAGEGFVIDVRAAIAARKVLLGQISDAIVEGQIQASDEVVLNAWNSGLNVTVAEFYSQIYNTYVPQDFEPVNESEIPFAAPEPINANWQ